VKDNVVKGSGDSKSGADSTLINADFISFINNSFGAVIINGGSYILFEGNKTDASKGYEGLKFNSDCPNSTFIDNEITYYKSKSSFVSCITIKTGINLSGSILIEKNSCIEK
uniref:hypothetical protein n=1 Tax=Mariniflexile sp. TaxID=1979402 RepID=UPI004047BCCC